MKETEEDTQKLQRYFMLIDWKNTGAIVFIFWILFSRWSVALSPREECSGAIWLIATSASLVQALLLPQPLSSWDYKHSHHYTWLNFVFLGETGFCHVGQAGLELLTSGDPATLASQIAGITGVSHRACPDTMFSNLP